MIQQTRKALFNFMKESRKTQKQISKETGLSTSVISQFLNETYSGDNEQIAETISRYLTIGKERLNTVQKSCFYPGLYNTQEVLFACNYAHRKMMWCLSAGTRERARQPRFDTTPKTIQG